MPNIPTLEGGRRPEFLLPSAVLVAVVSIVFLGTSVVFLAFLRHALLIVPFAYGWQRFWVILANLTI